MFMDAGNKRYKVKGIRFKVDRSEAQGARLRV
jgi:hypothetical protein